ncbi:hypothetical protein SDC9_70904 [bioreactor metagenome]|uniref:Uncharacterized protein n=1 Tax=bioreactor metagenome TaxID=1076179 RepID=A0A644Y749_9ZZZZ
MRKYSGGTGKLLRELLNVANVANAIYLFLQIHNDPEVINIGYDSGITPRLC